MEEELRWRVVYGFKSDQYVSIGEDMLEKAKYAMVTGKIFAHKDKMIRGERIVSIEPDYRFYTGWYDSYTPNDGDDFAQIKRDVPIAKLKERFELADERVKIAITTKSVATLLKEPEKIKA